MQAGVTRKFCPLTLVGWLMAGALLTCGLLYRTYDISMPTAGLQFARDIGFIFLLAEAVFIYIAYRWGFSIAAITGRMDRGTKMALALFLCTFWWGAAFVSPKPAISIILTIRWPIHLLFGAALFFSLNDVTDKMIARLGAILCTALMLLASIIAFHFIFVPPGLSPAGTPFGWGIAIPGFISGRLFGAYCGAILSLMLGLAWLHWHEGRVRLWHYPAITMLAAMAIWSGTRAAVLGVGCALVICAVIVRVPVKIRFLAIVCVCLTLAAIIATALIPYDDPYFVMFETKDMASGNAATGGRVTLWRAIIGLWMQNPLFGAGAGASAWMAPPGIFPHIQPHNVILQFLLSWGIIATVPALYLLGRAIWVAHRTVALRSELLPVLAMLDALLVMGMLDGMFFFPRFVMLIFACLAILLAAGSRGTPLPARGSER